MTLTELAAYVEGVAGRAEASEDELDEVAGLAIVFVQAQRHYMASGCGDVVRHLVPPTSLREARAALADATASLERCAGDTLLSLDAAAKILGYSVAGLRKIVSRTKAGKPGIKFAQIGNGPIKFRREWLDEFTVANMATPRPRTKPKHW